MPDALNPPGHRVEHSPLHGHLPAVAADLARGRQAGGKRHYGCKPGSLFEALCPIALTRVGRRFRIDPGYDVHPRNKKRKYCLHDTWQQLCRALSDGARTAAPGTIRRLKQRGNQGMVAEALETSATQCRDPAGCHRRGSIQAAAGAASLEMERTRVK